MSLSSEELNGLLTLKEKLGKPMIEISYGRVTYLEHTLDQTHILSFNYFDDEFNDLKYFAIDG